MYNLLHGLLFFFTEKEKATEEGQQKDVFSKEIAILTGSGDSRLGEEAGVSAL